MTPARQASPCIRAPTRVTSRPRTCAKSPASSRRCRDRGRVQHRRGSAAGLARSGRAVRPDQCTLVPVHPGEITSQAGWPPDTPASGLRAIVARLQAARRAREPVRRSRADAVGVGGGAWAPIASSSTPSRSRARSSGARGGRGAASTRYAAAARLAHARASASTPATTSTSTTSCSSATAAPRRGVDRPCAHQPRALRRPRSRRPRLRGGRYTVDHVPAMRFVLATVLLVVLLPRAACRRLCSSARHGFPHLMMASRSRVLARGPRCGLRRPSCWCTCSGARGTTGNRLPRCSRRRASAS